jgi:hypothetical protein
VSFRRLVLFFTFLAIFTMAFRVSIDSDTWWHLRAGAEILERGAVITEDPFSLTRFQQPWRYPGWLSQVILFSLYKLMGYAGLNLLTALMVTLAFLWVWPHTEGSLLRRSALLLLAAAASGVYWSARPQIFSFALTGFFIHFLERERAAKSNPLWAYLLAMALWANIHGGFAIGFLLIGAYLGGEVLVLMAIVIKDPARWQETFDHAKPKLIRFAWIILLSLLGLCLNPHGPSMVLYPFKTVSIGALREYIQEWQSPDFHALEVQPFLWMFFLAFVGFSAAPKRQHPTDYLLVLGFAFMSFWAARNIALFALVAVVPISRALSSISFELPWLRSSKEFPQNVQKIVNMFLAVGLLLAAIVKISIPWARANNQQSINEMFPTEAIDFLRTSVSPGPIFNSYNWGAYLIWELYPEYRSFVDGRTDLFNDEILEDYLSAWRGEPAWRDVFEQWGIEVVLIEPFSPLAAELRLSGWDPIYEAPDALVFIDPGKH